MFQSDSSLKGPFIHTLKKLHYDEMLSSYATTEKEFPNILTDYRSFSAFLIRSVISLALQSYPAWRERAAHHKKQFKSLPPSQNMIETHFQNASCDLTPLARILILIWHTVTRT